MYLIEIKIQMSKLLFLFCNTSRTFDVFSIIIIWNSLRFDRSQSVVLKQKPENKQKVTLHFFLYLSNCSFFSSTQNNQAETFLFIIL